MVIIVAVIMTIILVINKKEEYILIPNESIRIRVIANSNDDYDIKIKEILKDKLNIELEKILGNINNIKDIRKNINNNLDFINNFVDKILEELNYKQKFSVKYGFNYFPEKIFNGIKYDSGLYESLVVILGDGKGPNYWCVLYPPICSIDNNKDEIEYRSLLIDLLNKYL